MRSEGCRQTDNGRFIAALKSCTVIKLIQVVGFSVKGTLQAEVHDDCMLLGYLERDEL